MYVPASKCAAGNVASLLCLKGAATSVCPLRSPPLASPPLPATAATAPSRARARSGRRLPVRARPLGTPASSVPALPHTRLTPLSPPPPLAETFYPQGNIKASELFVSDGSKCGRTP